MLQEKEIEIKGAMAKLNEIERLFYNKINSFFLLVDRFDKGEEF